MGGSGMQILFQGDSITDCGRSRENMSANWGLGNGYVQLIAGQLTARMPERDYQIHNRGISGNRVVDLYARWKVDAINLKPDMISILIGVNDTWHEKNYNNGVEPERYGVIYRMLLEWTREALPDTRLVLCEPFVLCTGAVSSDWLPEIARRGDIVRELAEEYDAVYVPFQRVFDHAATLAPDKYWLPDGVHPSPAGHQLMADAWIAEVFQDVNR